MVIGNAEVNACFYERAHILLEEHRGIYDNIYNYMLPV